MRSVLKLTLNSAVSARNPTAATTGRPVYHATAAQSAASTNRSHSESRYLPSAVTRSVSLASCPSALSSTVFSCISSAATTSSPRARSTAATTPVAAAASTTAGGGTRSGASTSTSTCASGRKSRSHSHSCTARGLRDRASALDKRPFCHRAAREDQLARGVDLVPDVPEQDAARPPLVVDVRDDALAVRLVPTLHRRKARVELADRLVAEIEEVGVEERNVVIRHVGARHVRADGFPVRVRVVLVLDPVAPAERGDREVRDVAGREHVVAPVDAAVLVDDDAVVDGQSGGSGEVRVRHDPEPCDERVAGDRLA